MTFSLGSLTSHRRLLLSSTILLLIIMIGIVSVRIYHFHRYTTYFRQSLDHQQIEEWMTFRQIDRVYHISPSLIFTGSEKRDIRSTIREYCDSEKIICTDFISRLNQLKNAR